MRSGRTIPEFLNRGLDEKSAGAVSIRHPARVAFGDRCAHNTLLNIPYVKVRTMKLLQTVFLLSLFSLGAQAQDSAVEQVSPGSLSDSALQFEAFVAENKIAHAIEFGVDAFSGAFETLDKDDTALVPLGLMLGAELNKRGAYQQAYGIINECLSRLERKYGVDSREVIPALMALAPVQNSSFRLATYQRALALHNELGADDRRGYAKMALEAGKHLAYQRANRKEAARLLRESLDIYKREYGGKSVEVITPLMLLGGATVEWNSYKGSKRLFDRAINIAKKSGDRQLYATQLRSAGTYLLQSHSSDTGKYLNKALKEFNALLGPDHYETARAQLRVSEFYLRKGKEDKAEPGLLAALEVFDGNPDYRSDILSALSMLVEMYELRGESDKATPFCRTIGEIDPWTDNQMASPIYQRRVKYPPTAAQNGYRGYVLTEFEVDENGFVQSPVVVESRGPNSFEREALRAIKAFRYAPRFVNGEAVSTPNVQYKIMFNLDRRQRGTR